MNLTQIILQSKLQINEISTENAITLKKTLLNMYKDILEVCNQSSMVLLLGGGTCLGAIRHQGFIPWDDDLDLNMFRSDYEKLPEILESFFPGKYKCISPSISNHTDLPFMKVEKIGTLYKTIYDLEEELPAIAIDIFPIENVPNNKFLYYIHGIIINSLLYISVCVKLYKRRKCTATSLILSTKEGRTSLQFRFIIGFLFSFLTYNLWYKISDKISSKFKSKQTHNVSIPTGRCHYFGERRKRKDFLPSITVDFEGIKSYVPNNFDLYLFSLYGDYMSIPKEENREKHFCTEIKF